MSERVDRAAARGAAGRLDYFAGFAERHGCSYDEAQIVAKRAEALFQSGEYMNTDRLMVECKMAKRRAA